MFSEHFMYVISVPRLHMEFKKMCFGLRFQSISKQLCKERNGFLQIEFKTENRKKIFPQIEFKTDNLFMIPDFVNCKHVNDETLFRCLSLHSL